MADALGTVMIGVRRWHAGVARELATGRWVTLTFEYMDNAELPAITTALSPADARQVGEALVHYAEQAETRNTSEMN